MIETPSTRAVGATLGRVLPVKLAAMEKAKTPPRLFLTLGMQRSGQHLIIRWLCQNLGEVIHFNFCHFRRQGLSLVLTPRTGRRVVYRSGGIDDNGIQTADALYASLPTGQFASLLYSLEDHDPGEPRLRRLIHRHRHCLRVLVVLRDPYNWLASTLRLQDESPSATQQRVERYKRYLTFARNGDWPFDTPVTNIHYHRFVLSEAYRRRLADQLGIEVVAAAESALTDVPAFGGGSSFSGTNRSEDLNQAVFQRWRHFVDDPHYRSMVTDREMAALDAALFPGVPSLAECRRTLRLQASPVSGANTEANRGTDR